MQAMLRNRVHSLYRFWVQHYEQVFGLDAANLGRRVLISVGG